MQCKRRIFIKKLSQLGLSIAVMTSTGSLILSCGVSDNQKKIISNNLLVKKELGKPFFEISLAEWSLHKTLKAGKLTNMEFPEKTKNDFGINAVEYVNQSFMDKAENKNHLWELKQRGGLGVKNVLIMVDAEGSLGSSNDKERKTVVENHYKRVEAARFLGCYSIRVNAVGVGTADEVSVAAVDGSSLTNFAKDYEIGVIVKNHSGYSSNGQWLSDVMRKVNMPECGTLPDFGNFCIKREKGTCVEEYDCYKGVEELILFEKGVSAKSGKFDINGLEERIDYYKMLKTVKDGGYTGYIGIEYSGEIPEDEGIRVTKKLLEKVGLEIS